jgi:hypothetical protein
MINTKQGGGVDILLLYPPRICIPLNFAFLAVSKDEPSLPPFGHYMPISLIFSRESFQHLFHLSFILVWGWNCPQEGTPFSYLHKSIHWTAVAVARAMENINAALPQASSGFPSYSEQKPKPLRWPTRSHTDQPLWYIWTSFPLTLATGFFTIS